MAWAPQLGFVDGDADVSVNHEAVPICRICRKGKFRFIFKVWLVRFGWSEFWLNPTDW
jgi:hypothetical protein